MKKLRLTFLILLTVALVVALSACSGNPTAAVTEQPSDAAPYPAAYPEAESAYPEVEQDSAGGAGGGSSLYPDLESGAQIEWLQAFSLILNGEASQVTQAPDLQVMLMLKDGRSFVATAPNAAELQMTVDQCGALCQDLQLTIE